MKAVQKQLIEKCGGLEAAQRVVDSAPSQARYWHLPSKWYYSTYEGIGLLYRGHEWHRTDSPISQLDNGTDLIKLSDIRTAIIAQREFDLGLAPNGAYVKSGFPPLNHMRFDRVPELQRDAALNILHDDLQKRVDAVFSIMSEYRSNSVDVMTGMAFDEIEKALKGETL